MNRLAAVAAVILFASFATSAEVDDAVKLLRSKKAAERVKGMDELEKLGEKAKPASFDLLDVMLANFPRDRDRYLEVLEKVDPAIHPHVVTIMVDRNFNDQVRAMKSLQVAGKDAIGAVPVLAGYLRLTASVENGPHISGPSQKEALLALGEIAPDHKLTQAAVVGVIASPRNSYQSFSRLDAIALAKTLKLDAKTVLPALLTALSASDETTKIIDAIGDYGPAAKAALTTLGKYKLDSNKDVRDAANAAIERIKG